MNKRTAVLLLICLALAATTVTLRYLEREKEKIKSQFVPPPDTDDKRVRWVTTTVMPLPEEPAGGLERTAQDGGRETYQEEGERVIPEEREPIAQSIVVPPTTAVGGMPEKPERDMVGEELTEEAAALPERDVPDSYGEDLVTPLEEEPVEEEEAEPEGEAAPKDGAEVAGDTDQEGPVLETGEGDVLQDKPDDGIDREQELPPIEEEMLEESEEGYVEDEYIEEELPLEEEGFEDQGEFMEDGGEGEVPFEEDEVPFDEEVIDSMRDEEVFIGGE